MDTDISNVRESREKIDSSVQEASAQSKEQNAERSKPKMAGNKSFRNHNKLRFSRTHTRREMGLKNRI